MELHKDCSKCYYNSKFPKFYGNRVVLQKIPGCTHRLMSLELLKLRKDKPCLGYEKVEYWREALT